MSFIATGYTISAIGSPNLSAARDRVSRDMYDQYIPGQSAEQSRIDLEIFERNIAMQQRAHDRMKAVRDLVEDPFFNPLPILREGTEDEISICRQAMAALTD